MREMKAKSFAFNKALDQALMCLDYRRWRKHKTPWLTGSCLGLVIGALNCTLVSASEMNPPPEAQQAFQKELELAQGVHQKYGPIIELLDQQTKVQICGTYTKDAQINFLKRKHELQKLSFADFDTLKALRYLSLLAADSKVRQLAPWELKDWCAQHKNLLKDQGDHGDHGDQNNQD